MKKRSAISILLVLFLITGALKSQTVASDPIDVIIKGFETKAFSATPVSEMDLTLILKCGLQASSARNRQLWKFTVVKDAALLKDVIPDFTPGNVLILVSGQEDAPEGTNIDIDCSIATANMFIGGQLLGLGVHIYGGPVNKINQNMRPDLGIPDGYKVVSLLRVGNIDKTIDAASGASTRKDINEVVNYR